MLDENLRQLGSVTGFAQNESIKAVRYINDTAYVITYEQTDPLFVIDVSDPSQPAIKGEVKISGFSTLLVPVDDNTLLGIGYHTTDITEGDAAMEMQDGVKIVTFDVSDKSDPKVLDTQIFENYYSAVQHDPKALLVNFERGDFTIPMSKQEWTLDGWKNTSEALNFRVENGKIKIIDTWSAVCMSATTSTCWATIMRKITATRITSITDMLNIGRTSTRRRINEFVMHNS